MSDTESDITSSDVKLPETAPEAASGGPESGKREISDRNCEPVPSA